MDVCGGGGERQVRGGGGGPKGRGERKAKIHNRTYVLSNIHYWKNAHLYRLLNRYRFSGTNKGGTFVPGGVSPRYKCDFPVNSDCCYSPPPLSFSFPFSSHLISSQDSQNSSQLIYRIIHRFTTHTKLHNTDSTTHTNHEFSHSIIHRFIPGTKRIKDFQEHKLKIHKNMNHSQIHKNTYYTRSRRARSESRRAGRPRAPRQRPRMRHPPGRLLGEENEREVREEIRLIERK
jgi:hypothetical protein